MSRATTAANLLLSLAAIAISSYALLQASRANDPSRVIEARGLLIKDASGQTRVELGAPVQDPVVQGRRGTRATPSSGLILLGPDGNERGGYLTSDVGGEAMLTLDSGDGSVEVLKVVANPDAGASLFVLHRNGAGAMLTTYRGRPELQLIDKSGTVLFSEPGATSE
ncbi:hypothetical protein LDO32_02030 [Luteimonas sp. Y-2-2-4F]|nr:hypothetical protein [Luteimonas sp. Y-2-2-4F]MCD9030513.1 hypothetical protein [Luteimonas sp. Y-2-2-4F]